MNKIVKKEIDFAGRKLVLETGELAMQANMAVKATYGESVVLATVVSGESNPDTDFFPLTVNYEERLYASGIIKNSRFVKRDGRPNDEAVITRRLIDHAIRPLFPEDYMDEIQVAVTILSLDDTSDPEFLSMIAVSAALHASDIPWDGPMGTTRLGYINNEYVLNPSKLDLHTKSELDMMVSFVGADKKILALEAEANILPEEKILGAIEYANSHIDGIISMISDFAKEVNPDAKKYIYNSRALNPELLADVSSVAKDVIVKMLGQGFDKTKLKTEADKLLEEIYIKYEGKYKKADMSRAFSAVEEHALQHLILDEQKRPDGRGIKDIRPITTSIGVLPRVHGSGLFTRGVTQVMTVATLGSPSLELFVQDIYGERTKRYIHYYNFPPYSVGEVGKMGGTGGREIGHGMLAEKALRPVIPEQKDFPYTIILVSETLSSSGSSSMAATCGSTLALMDAGVPIKEMVAGVGVGLIVSEDMTKQLVMTDLAYLEDAFGFLDFKMTGTRTGVTAIQADMKIKGIPMDLLPKIIEQSHEGRMHVLDEMEKTIKTPKATVSKYAPKTFTTKIDPEKIGVVIGSGGKTIKEIQERTMSEISIEEDGTIVVTAISEENGKQAIEFINNLTREFKPGEILDGIVKEIVDFGAFVEVAPGKDGLLHISELANGYVKNVEDVVKVGDPVKVKVLDVSRDGKISLSIKALDPNAEISNDRYERPQRPSRDGRGSRDRNRNSRY